MNCTVNEGKSINLCVYLSSIMFNRPYLFLPCSCSQEEPTYSALWGDNKAFDEVIISPAMLNEHMPHMVMEGLNKVCFMCVHVDGFDGCGFFWNAGEMDFKSCFWFPTLDNWIWWMTSICEMSLSIKIQMHSPIFFNNCSQRGIPPYQNTFCTVWNRN